MFEHIFQRFEQADAILIGGGAGLSASAGLDASGEGFRREFATEIAHYGFSDLYSAGFYPFPTERHWWAHWAHHADYFRHQPPALPLYKELAKLVEDRNYYVITTNVDAQFAKAGFPEDRVFAVQGDMAEMQCAKGCHQKVYPNLEAIRTMRANTHDFCVDERFLPRCPVCHGPINMHLRIDQYFVEDEHWHEMATRYQDFLGKYADRKLFMLELGVGFNTPTIIRFPFRRLARLNPDSTLLRINLEKERPEAAGNIFTWRCDIAEGVRRLLN